jgi:hypothetical protein
MFNVANVTVSTSGIVYLLDDGGQTLFKSIKITGELIMKILRTALIVLLPFAGSAWTGDLTTDAAIGGAIGGAVGGAVGAEVGGRDGAIVGAGVGAAAGTAINTRDHVESRERDYDDRDRYERDRERDHSHGPDHFCPPGQAKKGKC